MRLLLSLSGGLDSTTLLAHALSLNHDVQPVVFSYPSKHNPFEREAANAVCRYYDCDPIHIDLRAAFEPMASALLLGGGDIPEGHYTDQSMTQTVVPGRNMIFLSVLGGIAMSAKTGMVWFGAHAGDHAIYPDCRPDFVQAMDQAMMLATDGKVRLNAPYLMANKTDILRDALRLNAPLHLTRTCYKNQAKPCGLCGACRERAEAFETLAANDPCL